MARRRRLAFSRLVEVMPDVERLLAGHATVGQWTLGQICNHLATGIRITTDAFPAKAPWVVRRTAGVVLGRLLLWRGWIPPGLPVPASILNPGPALDAGCEAESLRLEIERFLSFSAPFDEHPLFGPMTPAQWERFHCIHAAHHLSFVLPR